MTIYGLSADFLRTESGEIMDMITELEQYANSLVCPAWCDQDGCRDSQAGLAHHQTLIAECETASGYVTIERVVGLDTPEMPPGICIHVDDDEHTPDQARELAAVLHAAADRLERILLAE